MDANSIKELLSSISVGTVMAWISVICAIIGALCTGTIKLYKVFTKYRNIKDANQELRDKVDIHERQLDDIKKQLDIMSKNFAEQFSDIKNTLDEHRSTKITELRHDITEAGEKALSDRKMTIRQWNSLHEMLDQYENRYHQNSYVKSLMEKVDRDVQIIGAIDEHGMDID